MSDTMLSVLENLRGFAAAIAEIFTVTSDPQTPPAPRAHFDTVGTRPKTDRGNVLRYSKVRPSFAAPAEKDFILRPFQILNPEGEIHTVDTSDRASRFYGPVWTRVLDAFTKDEFLRGRVFMRCISSEDRFSGYMVSIDGLKAFLPQSKATVFYDPEKDATNKCLALKVDAVYTNGARQGDVIVNAKPPWKQTLNEFTNLEPGRILFALASDHENDKLVFPGRRGQKVFVPLGEAVNFGERIGVAEPDFLTGLYWKLELRFHAGDSWIARPVELLA